MCTQESAEKVAKKMTRINSNKTTPNTIKAMRKPRMVFDSRTRHSPETIMSAFVALEAHDRESRDKSGSGNGIRFIRPESSPPPSRASRMGLPTIGRKLKLQYSQDSDLTESQRAEMSASITDLEYIYIQHETPETKDSIEKISADSKDDRDKITALLERTEEIRAKAVANAESMTLSLEIDSSMLPEIQAIINEESESKFKPEPGSTHEIEVTGIDWANADFEKSPWLEDLWESRTKANQNGREKKGLQSYGVDALGIPGLTSMQTQESFPERPFPYRIDTIHIDWRVHHKTRPIEITDWNRLIKRNRRGNMVLISKRELNESIIGTLGSPELHTFRSKDTLVPESMESYLKRCKTHVKSGLDGLPERYYSHSHQNEETLDSKRIPDRKNPFLKSAKMQKTIGRNSPLVKLHKALLNVESGKYTPDSYDSEWRINHDFTIRNTGFRVPEASFVPHDLKEHIHTSHELLKPSQKRRLAEAQSMRNFANELLNGILLFWSHGVVNRRPNPEGTKEIAIKRDVTAQPSVNLIEYVKGIASGIKSGNFLEESFNGASGLPLDPNSTIICDSPLVHNFDNPLFPVLIRRTTPSLTENQGQRNNYGRNPESEIQYIYHPDEPTQSERLEMSPYEGKRTRAALIEKRVPFWTYGREAEEKLKTWHDGIEKKKILSRKVVAHKIAYTLADMNHIADSRQILREHREDLSRPQSTQDAKIQRKFVIESKPSMVADQSTGRFRVRPAKKHKSAPASTTS